MIICGNDGLYRTVREPEQHRPKFIMMVLLQHKNILE